MPLKIPSKKGNGGSSPSKPKSGARREKRQQANAQALSAINANIRARNEKKFLRRIR